MHMKMKHGTGVPPELVSQAEPELAPAAVVVEVIAQEDDESWGI